MQLQLKVALRTIPRGRELIPRASGEFVMNTPSLPNPVSLHRELRELARREGGPSRVAGDKGAAPNRGNTHPRHFAAAAFLTALVSA
jgi:hypothetical protein